jgi:hypothetical protein
MSQHQTCTKIETWATEDSKSMKSLM